MGKVIIFDFDGVLIDSFKLDLDIFQKLYSKFNLTNMTEEKFADLFEDNPWKSAEKYGVVNEIKDIFKKEFKKELLERADEIKFFDEIREMISMLPDARLVIATSSPSDFVQYILQKEHLDRHFDAILGLEVPGSKKEKITSYLKKNSISFKDVSFVTDTVGDINDVKELPIETVVVTWGFHSKKHLLKTGIKKIASNPQELLKYLQEDVT